MKQQISHVKNQRPDSRGRKLPVKVINSLSFCIVLAGLLAGFSGCQNPSTGLLTLDSPGLQLMVEVQPDSALVTRLGWDTEGTGRDTINLLKSPAGLIFTKADVRLAPKVTSRMTGSQQVKFTYLFQDGKRLTWEVSVKAGEMNMQVASDDDLSEDIDKIELVFPFDPQKAVTSMISSHWTDDGRFMLPAIVSAPDIGQLLLTNAENSDIKGYTEGSRKEGWVRVIIGMPVPGSDNPCSLKFTPVILPVPEGYADEERWAAARRGWFNLIQQSCGASGGGRGAIGVWANNVLSDPVSSLIYMLGDATVFIPELAPGVTMPPILLKAIEYFLDVKTTDYGMVGYTAGGKPAEIDDRGDPDPNDKGYRPGQHQSVMDSNPSILIGAWSYIKVTSDTVWLRKRISDLEHVAGYMESRDIDGDGLIESRQSGNNGTRPPRNPDMAWDCYSAGHKNAYINVLAYRAFNNLAELEDLLGNHGQAKKYRERTDKIKSVFMKTFYNPETGWLGWWRSRDGMLHDIWSDVPTSFAIANGVIGKEEGREMLESFWKALEATGFNRFDLGIPVCLRPVPIYEMEHPTDFQQFLNGGCCVINTSYTLDALYTSGMTEKADMIMNAMLKRQKEGVFPNGGGFQNGFIDDMGRGAEVFDWNGETAGYEGHLVYCWAFLHSMLRHQQP
jgi:hypothetical protein